MLEVVDQQLREWVGKTLGNVTFTLNPPGKDAAGSGGASGVSCYLLELVDAPPARGTDRPPLQFHVRYLITTWAETLEAAHKLLGNLAFAAMDVTEYRVEFDPLPPETWLAMGAAPRPAFILRVPVRQERPQPERHYVRKPLEMRFGPSLLLRGLLVTPDNIPITGAVVEMPSIQRATHTDGDGHFLFANIPGGLPSYQVKVKAKGRELLVTVQPPSSDQDTIVIRFDPISNP